MRRIEAFPANGRLQSTPEVVDATDAGTALDYCLEARGVAGSRVLGQSIERRRQRRLDSLRLFFGHPPDRQGRTHADEGFRRPFVPESHFERHWHDPARGHGRSEMADARAKTQRPRAHVHECPLGRDPQRVSWAFQHGAAVAKECGGTPARVQIDAEYAGFRENRIFRQHSRVDHAVMGIAGELPAQNECQERIPP